MRAIRKKGLGWLLLGAMVLGAPGCSPNLSRSAGGLEVEVLAPPAGTDTVRVRVARGEVEFTHEAPLSIGGAPLVVESIPEGEATVIVEAVRSSVVLGSVQRTVLITAGATTRLTVSFSNEGTDGGPGDTGTDAGTSEPSVESNPIRAYLRDLRDDAISGGNLRGVAQIDANDWTTFLSAATATLGHEPRVLRVKSVSVHLNVGASENVSSLSELFSGTITVTVTSQQTLSTAVVCQGTVPEGATEVLLTGAADQTMLDVLRSDLLSGNGRLDLSGPTLQSAGAGFRAQLTLPSIWIAR